MQRFQPKYNMVLWETLQEKLCQNKLFYDEEMAILQVETICDYQFECNIFR